MARIIISTLFTYSLPSGFVLFHSTIHRYRHFRRFRSICHSGCRGCYGYNDFNFHSTHGQRRKKVFASHRTRRNVHLFDFHNDQLLNKSIKKQRPQQTQVLFYFLQEMIEWMKYISVFSTLCFVIFFAIGPGSIPWMITAELFSQGPRPAAMSIAVLINWLSNFLVGIGFPTMQVCICKLKKKAKAN